MVRAVFDPTGDLAQETATKVTGLPGVHPRHPLLCGSEILPSAATVQDGDAAGSGGRRGVPDEGELGD